MIKADGAETRSFADGPRVSSSPPDGFYPGAGALPRGGSVPWLGTPRGEPAKAQHIGQGQMLEARPCTVTFDLRGQQNPSGGQYISAKIVEECRPASMRCTTGGHGVDEVWYCALLLGVVLGRKTSRNVNAYRGKVQSTVRTTDYLQSCWTRRLAMLVGICAGLWRRTCGATHVA